MTRFKVLLFGVFSRFFIFFTVSLNRIIYEKMKMRYMYIYIHSPIYTLYLLKIGIFYPTFKQFCLCQNVLKLGIFGQPAGRKIPMPGLHVLVMRNRLAIGNMLGGPSIFLDQQKWSQKFQWTLKLDFQLDV